jgi:hypothetical protein
MTATVLNSRCLDKAWPSHVLIVSNFVDQPEAA